MSLTFLRGYTPTHAIIAFFVLLVFLVGESPNFTLIVFPGPVSAGSFVLAVGIVFVFYKPKWPASPTPFRTSGIVHQGFTCILAWNTASDASIALHNALGVTPQMINADIHTYLVQGFTVVGGSIVMAWVILSQFTRNFQPH